MCVHLHFFPNNWKLEAIQMCKDRWMEKQIGVFFIQAMKYYTAIKKNTY